MKKTSKKSLFQKSRVIPVVLVAAFSIASVVSMQLVRADSLQEKIDRLSDQKSQKQNTVKSLQVQASSYEDAISKLQSQISGMQASIDANVAKQAALEDKIKLKQQELDQQKKILGADLKAMYVDGEMSTVEMLATSKNLSDFVDAETYREAVQGKIQRTLKTISQLQNQLKDQKTQVGQLIDAQKNQQAHLDANKAEKNRLLSLNEGQQVAYTKQIKRVSAEISKLQAEQVAQNQRLFGGSIRYGGTGNYPWANAPCPYGASGGRSCGNYDWGYPGNPYDPAGWQYRNCTSYAFWRLAQAKGVTLTAGSFPNVYNSGGKIGYSIPDFRNLGYRVDHNPAGATLAVEGAGPYGPGSYGHIMYIEGSYVSQYNALGDGVYSTAPLSSIISNDPNTWFIHM